MSRDALKKGSNLALGRLGKPCARLGVNVEISDFFPLRLDGLRWLSRQSSTSRFAAPGL